MMIMIMITRLERFVANASCFSHLHDFSYVASIPENLEPGSTITFPEQYTTRVRDEDIGKAGVFALKLKNNNGTFEVSPSVAERTADFVIMVRNNTLIDYEMRKSLFFKVRAFER